MSTHSLAPLITKKTAAPKNIRYAKWYDSRVPNKLQSSLWLNNWSIKPASLGSRGTGSDRMNNG